MEQEQNLTAEVTGVSWNLSQPIIMEIAGYLQSAGTSFISYNYQNGFCALTAIRDRIIYYLNEEEKADFKKMETSIYKKIVVMRPNHAVTQNYSAEEWRIHNLIVNKCREEIQAYNDKIMNCLGKYGFLIKPAEDSKKMF